MNFIVRQRIFSFADSFDIKDEFGVAHYNVQGKFFAIGKKLDIYDMDRNHLIYIEEKIFRFLPEYFLYQGEEMVARVKKQLTFFKAKVDIESIYGDFTIDGSVLRYNFNIEKDGKVVAKITKGFITLSDTYMVSIDEDENQDFLLSLVIVIDQIFHDNRNNA